MVESAKRVSGKKKIQAGWVMVVLAVVAMVASVVLFIGYARSITGRYDTFPKPSRSSDHTDTVGTGENLNAFDAGKFIYLYRPEEQQVSLRVVDFASKTKDTYTLPNSYSIEYILSPQGTYLLRKDTQGLEVAPMTNPQAFRTVFTSEKNEFVLDADWSKDETKLVFVTGYTANRSEFSMGYDEKRLYVGDGSGKNIHRVKSYPKYFDDIDIRAVDSAGSSAYWQNILADSGHTMSITAANLTTGELRDMPADLTVEKNTTPAIAFTPDFSSIFSIHGPDGSADEGPGQTIWRYDVMTKKSTILLQANDVDSIESNLFPSEREQAVLYLHNNRLNALPFSHQDKPRSLPIDDMFRGCTMKAISSFGSQLFATCLFGKGQMGYRFVNASNGQTVSFYEDEPGELDTVKLGRQSIEFLGFIE